MPYLLRRFRGSAWHDSPRAASRAPNKQLERTVIRQPCAPHVRHFIMRTRRAGQRSAPPLNCGVR
jgi:hypothetical protein